MSLFNTMIVRCMCIVLYVVVSILISLCVYEVCRFSVHCKCTFLFHNIFSLLSVVMFEVDIVTLWYWLELHPTTISNINPLSLLDYPW